jgi:serine/threonine protein kinase
MDIEITKISEEKINSKFFAEKNDLKQQKILKKNNLFNNIQKKDQYTQKKNFDVISFFFYLLTAFLEKIYSLYDNAKSLKCLIKEICIFLLSKSVLIKKKTLITISFFFTIFTNFRNFLKKSISEKSEKIKTEEKKEINYFENKKNNFIRFSEKSTDLVTESEISLEKRKIVNVNTKKIFTRNMRKLSEHFTKEFIAEEIRKEKKKKIIKDFPIFLENEKFANCFKDKELIGYGGFGEVYKARHILEDRTYCIKKISFMAKNDQNLHELGVLEEVRTMVTLKKHNNIVEYCTSWIEKENKQQLKKFKTSYDNLNYSNSSDFEKLKKKKNKDLEDFEDDDSFKIEFESDSENDEETSFKKFDETKLNCNKSCDLAAKNKTVYNLYIQMQFCKDESLDKYLLNPNIVFEESHCFYLFSQILSGVKYIHSKNLIHHDLKPGNIFLHKNEIKIGDFGLATFSKKNKEENNLIEENTKSVQDLIRGTPLYSAPEISENINTQKSDVYSLGIILFVLLSQFKTYHESIINLQSVKNTNRVPEEFGQKYPVVAPLINFMLEKDISKRPESFDIEKSDVFLDWKHKVTSFYK